MGAYVNIPLAGAPAPRQNPYQAFAEGQHNAAVRNDMDAQAQQRQQAAEALELENEQRRQEAASQSALKEHLMNSEGDMDKFHKLASADGRVNPKTVFAFQQQRANAVRAQAQTDAALLAAEKIRHDEARGQFMGYEQNPDELKAKNWQNFLQSVKPNMKPDEFERFAQQYPEYPGAEAMKAHSNFLAFGSQLTKEAMDQQRVNATLANAAADQRRAAAAEATSASVVANNTARQEGLRADSRQKVRADLAPRLAGAQTQEEYDAILADVPHAVAKDAPKWNAADPDETTNAVLQWASTPKEIAAGELAATKAAEKRVLDADLMRHRKVLESQGWSRDARAKDKSVNVSRADINKARTEIDQAVKTEGELHTLRRNLGVALASKGKLYVDRLGNVVPMAKQAASDDAAAQDLRKALDERYVSVTEQLQNTLRQKYDAGSRLGMAPKIGLDEALAALNAPAAKPPAASAPVAPAASPAAKKPAAAAPQAAEAPPAEIVAKVKEGGTISGSDGSKWKKVNGTMVKQ